MVQSININGDRPIYNAVKISISKPEVNAGNNKNSYVDDNGIYNAVNINIDNPSVNTEPKKIYDYPENNEIVTYDMIGNVPTVMPQSYNVVYHSASIVLPEEEPENTNDIVDVVPVEIEPEEVKEDVEILDAEVENSAVKKPEIVPGEEIKPEVDIALTVSNLSNEDMDIQAQQMEEIARIAFDNPDNALPYLVTDIFSNLINIINKDTSKLPVPTEEQIDARKKIITNFFIAEQAKQSGVEPQLPYQITEKEMEIADKLSPLEQAERNKQYALYTTSVLTKIYVDEVEKQTGNVVPLTDLPGSAAMVDALRYNNNSGVKMAAIDSLYHIQRPEYEKELKTLYSLAAADSNPEVAALASQILKTDNN